MKNSLTLIAFISAFALHIIIGGLLLIGIDFSLPKEKPSPSIITASAVSQKLFDDLAQRKKEKIRAEQRKKELLRKKRERIEREKQQAEQLRRKIEADRIKAKQAEALRKKREAERIQAEKITAAKRLKAKRKKQEAERAKAAKIAREKAAKEKAAREKAAREKAAREKAAREKAAREKAAREKAAREKERLRQAELDRQMEAEFADEFSSAQSAKQISEIARYKALIQNKIGRNWQVGPNMKGKSCTLAIRLAADGLVLSAKRSRGDEKLCASAKRAALKAKTLPIPKDPEIAPQFRDFDITLEPDL